MAHSYSRNKRLAQLPVLVSSHPIPSSAMGSILSALDGSDFFELPYSKNPRCPDIIFASRPRPRRREPCCHSSAFRRIMRKLPQREEPMTARVKAPREFSVANSLMSMGCAAGGLGVGYMKLDRAEDVNSLVTSDGTGSPPPAIVLTPTYEKWEGWEWWTGPGNVGVLMKARKEVK